MNHESRITNRGKRKNAAFTLVEAMVAISILSLSITGPMVIAQKGIGSAIYARDQITAFYLAQEAVEYIRNIRDSNRINLDPWLSYLSLCLSGGTCQIDSRYTDYQDVEAVKSCPSGICPKLSINTSQNFYGYGSGASWKETPFTRTIQMEETVSSREALISVTISWNTNLFAPLRTFTIKEYIYNF
ncbi:MAG: prepilin-type N-terminal cleavage/methylation domain-containing protein [Candidatus Paceibacterota bacterium]|jgi:Tfp pilus assembly protein PilV